MEPQKATAADPLRGLLAVVLALALIALVGFFMAIGKSVLLPIVLAVISVYVLVAASEALTRLPGGAQLPGWLRRCLVLIAFLVAMLFLGGVMVSTAEQLAGRMPSYLQNLNALLTQLASVVGVDNPDWQKMWKDLVDGLPLQRFASLALGSIAAAAGLITMVVVYAMFLMGERGDFAHKIAVALPGERGIRASKIVAQVNGAISDYLAVKTLVNIILATLSYLVLWVFGVDFALFWAVLIGVLNYIPYVGSLLGVVFPVALTMAQFGSIQTTIGVGLLLTAMQVWVGNALEPRMIGRKVNMSPFVVLVALALWSAIWGIAGAILAIPLTSIIAIIMASFASTRPFAILLAQDVSVFAGDHRVEAKADPA
ncbi:MAG: AI-2E family transporter [Rhodobacterales bacterium]|nr:AI-2E family transporter [Rhodobacterales bacterium]